MTTHAFPHRGSQHERWLLTAAQHNDRRAQEELIRRYEPLVRAASRRWNPPVGCEREDLEQVARFGLSHAVRTWQPDRGAFRAYATTCVRNSVLNEIRAAAASCRQILSTALSIDNPPAQRPQSQRRPVLDPSLVQPSGGFEHVGRLADPVAIVLSRERLGAIRGWLPGLTDRERRLLAGALNGKTQQQLADEEHTSWRAINSAMSRLRAKLTAESAG